MQPEDLWAYLIHPGQQALVYCDAGHYLIVEGKPSLGLIWYLIFGSTLATVTQ